MNVVATNAEREPTSTPSSAPASAPASAPQALARETEELSTEESAWLEAYRNNEVQNDSPTEVVETAPDGTEVPVEIRPGEKEDPDEVSLQNGQLVDRSGKRVPKVVPHAALHSEREGHKATKAKLTETQNQLSTILELLQKNPLQPAAAPKAQAEVDPLDEDDISPADDLLGAFAQMQRRQKAMTAKQLKQNQDSAASTQFRTVLSTYEADAAQMRQAEPSFNDAYEFWQAQVKAEYSARGVPEEELEKAVQLDELAIVKGAVNSKKRPAEMIYKLAVARGFSPAAKPNGKHPPPQVNAEAAEQIARIEAGKKANASLGDLPGRPGEGLTGKAVAEMSQAQFDKFYDEMSRKDPEKLTRLLNGTER